VLATTVNSNSSTGSVGFPLSDPVSDSDNPAGNDCPDFIVYQILDIAPPGAVAPNMSRVYCVPTVPVGNVLPLYINDGTPGALIVIVNSAGAGL
jgi:hypothetical protein